MTIRELRDNGVMSGRLYNSLYRGIKFDDKYAVWANYPGWRERVDVQPGELTVADIFELWTDEEMLRWRSFGPKALSELKGLLN